MLQLKHASDQHSGGDSRLNKASCQGQRYGHVIQPAEQTVVSIIQGPCLLCCAANAEQIRCCMLFTSMLCALHGNDTYSGTFGSMDTWQCSCLERERMQGRKLLTSSNNRHPRGLHTA